MRKLLILFGAFICIMFNYEQIYGQGASCDEYVAEPLCLGAACGAFPASTTGPEDTDATSSSTCLGGAPNAAWYYITVETAGTFNMNFGNSNGFDIDFAAWGPFPSAFAANCSSINTGNQVGCDYTTAPGGSITNVPAVAGDVFLVVITNFSGNATDITVNVSSGDGGELTCPCPEARVVPSIDLCSGDAVAPLPDYAAFDVSQVLTDKSAFQGAVVTSYSTDPNDPTAALPATLTNETCNAVDYTFYAWTECSQDCKATSAGEAVIGPFTVTVFPDTTWGVAEVPGACGTAGSVTLTAVNGDECLMQMNGVPTAPSLCGTTDDQSVDYSYTINVGQPCEVTLSGTVAATCDAPACCDEPGTFEP